MAISEGTATEGIVESESVIWVDLKDQDNITKALKKGLRQLSDPARILPGFELTTNLQRWQTLLNRGLQSKSSRLSGVPR